MIMIRDKSGMSKAIPWILQRKFGFALLGRLIEPYYPPTAVDVVLVVLEGEAELAKKILSSNYDDHYNN